MLRRFCLISLLFLPGFATSVVHGQTEPIARPRRTQTAPAPTETTERQAHPRDASAERLYKIGVKYGVAGLYPQAAEMFEQAVKLRPDYADAYLSLGHAYYDLRQWEPAIDSLQRGLALKPDDKDSRRRLAHARMMFEREQEQVSANGESNESARVRTSPGSPAPSAKKPKPLK